MENEEQKVYWADDDEYRIYCANCDKFAVDRYYTNHLKSQT